MRPFTLYAPSNGLLASTREQQVTFCRNVPRHTTPKERMSRACWVLILDNHLRGDFHEHPFVGKGPRCKASVCSGIVNACNSVVAKKAFGHGLSTPQRQLHFPRKYRVYRVIFTLLLVKRSIPQYMPVGTPRFILSAMNGEFQWYLMSLPWIVLSLSVDKKGRNGHPASSGKDLECPLDQKVLEEMVEPPCFYTWTKVQCSESRCICIPETLWMDVLVSPLTVP